MFVAKFIFRFNQGNSGYLRVISIFSLQELLTYPQLQASMWMLMLMICCPEAYRRHKNGKTLHFSGHKYISKLSIWELCTYDTQIWLLLLAAVLVSLHPHPEFSLSPHWIPWVELGARLEPLHLLADQIRPGWKLRGRRPSHFNKGVVDFPSKEDRHHSQGQWC